MPMIHINGLPCEVLAGERLMDVLTRLGLAVEHPCGGRGVCQKCRVVVDGETVLSCRYILGGGECVTTGADAPVVAVAGSPSSAIDETPLPDDCDLVLDIGSTTLAMGVVSRADGRLVRVVTANNPQRMYGADVMSRIAHAMSSGLNDLTGCIRAEIARLVEAAGVLAPKRLIVAANTTMLHLFLGVDPSPMGVAPYTPVFLEEKRCPGTACGLDEVGEVICLPSMAAFVGADLVAGLHHVGLPAGKDYYLLMDLGTNAEILLVSRDRVLCSAAAAGPCLEGASISCGMPATNGAISAFEADGSYEVIGGGAAKGLCGTGLVDVIAALLDTDVLDEAGNMACGSFYLGEDVYLSQDDVRQFQLAKAAIAATVEILIGEAGITEEAISSVFIAGGFAAGIRPATAARTGLLTPRLSTRCTAVGNACLAGLVRYAKEGGDLARYTAITRYVDPAADARFSEAFVRHMLFL